MHKITLFVKGLNIENQLIFYLAKAALTIKSDFPCHTATGIQFDGGDCTGLCAVAITLGHFGPSSSLYDTLLFPILLKVSKYRDDLITSST